MTAAAHLQKSLRELQQRPLGGFKIDVEDDLFKWTVWFLGPKGTPYHPGIYKAQLSFPQEFPFKPPEFRILSSFWHPNIYAETGKICISILHAPGVDETNQGETAQMRWTPIQSIQTVLVSIISVLSDPDPSDSGAPANVDALVEYRKNRTEFNRRCAENAKKSIRELPPSFVPPEEEDAPPSREPSAIGLGPQASSFAPEFEYAEQDEEEEEEEESAAAAATPPKPTDRTGGASSPYLSELQQLRDMNACGSKSDAEVLDLLKQCKGDLGQVMDRLYAQ